MHLQLLQCRLLLTPCVSTSVQRSSWYVNGNVHGHGHDANGHENAHHVRHDHESVHDLLLHGNVGDSHHLFPAASYVNQVDHG